MRAIGRPDWMVSIVVSQAERTSGNEQCPAEIASGMPNRRKAISTITPSVPSEPTNRWVRSYPAEDFLRPRAGAHERSVRGDDAERQDELLHRAVAHRVGARGAGRGHAAERGVGARIDREEQAAVAQMLVELLAGDAGLDDAVEILGVDRDNRVHARAVEREAAMRRVDMAFQRRAHPEGRDRRVVPGAEFHRVDHVVSGFGEHDRVRRLVLEPGQRVPMRGADRRGGGEAIAEAGGELGVERLDRIARHAAFALADGEGKLSHGLPTRTTRKVRS